MWKTFRLIWKMLDNPERWYWHEEKTDVFTYRYYPASLDMQAYASRDKALTFTLSVGMFFGWFDVYCEQNVFIYPWWMRWLLAKKATKMHKNAKKTKRKKYIRNFRDNEYSRIMNAIMGVKKNDS